MPLFFADLVREYSFSSGTADLVLEGPVAGCRGFAGVVPAGARFHYAISGVTRPEEWETGEGEIGSGGTLVRSPFASSAGGGLVAFSAGLKTVALTVAAAWYAEQEQPAEIGDVAGLQAALDGKAAAGHDHDAAYQARDEELSAIAALTGAADRLAYFTGPGAAALTPLSAFGRSLIDDAEPAAARATLGLGSAALKDTGTSGNMVALLDGANRWSMSQIFGSATPQAPSTSPIHINLGGSYSSVAGAHLKLKLFDNGTSSESYGLGISGGSLDSVVPSGAGHSLYIGGVRHLHVSTQGADVTGEMRCDSLRIDQAPAAAANVPATHKLAVNLNGTTYYLLLSSG